MVTQSTPQARNSRSGTWLVIAVIALFISHSAATFADDSQDLSRLPWRKHRFDLNLGVFFPSIDSSARLEPASGVVSASIDLEDQADLDNSEISPYLSGTFRIADRHAINFGYFEVNRDGNAIASGDIIFGDISIGANARFDTKFDTSIFRLGYEYAILTRDTWELALLAGIHYTSIDARISEDTLGLSESVDAEAPLPMIGFKNYFRYTDNLYVKLAVEWIDINFNNFDGSITNLSADLQYNITKNVGVGGGYTYFDIDINDAFDENNLSAKYTYNGPMLYLNVGF